MLFTCLCSSPSCYVWLWWFDFFITHDFHFGICAHISEIWNKEVTTIIRASSFLRSYYQLIQLYLILILLFSLKWALFGELVNENKFVVYSQDVRIFSHLMYHSGVFSHDSIAVYHCRCIKQFAWLVAVILSLLIIASRKHYTVDIVVAW